MPSVRKADVASTRLCSSEATAIYKEVAPTALLKSEMRLGVNPGASRRHVQAVQTSVLTFYTNSTSPAFKTRRKGYWMGAKIWK